MGSNDAQQKVKEPIQIVKFPSNLGSKRYIAFDFFSPDFEKDIGDGFKKLFTGSTGLDAGKIKTGITQVTTAFGKQLKKVKDRASTSVISQDIMKDTDSYIASIFLPLPNSISEVSQNSYEDSDGIVSNIINSMTSAAGKLAGKSDFSMDKIMSNIQQVGTYTGTRTLSLNPDKIQTFKGTSLRQLDLSWVFLPSSTDERDDILKIVRLFKKYAAPTTEGAGSLLLSPSFCEVTFTNPYLDDSLRFDEMVIDSVNITWGGANMETFSDGMVKQVEFSLKLLERRVKTAENWSEIRTGNNVRDASDPLVKLILPDGKNEEK